MIVYVGYIMGNYAQAVCMGLSKEEVEKVLATYNCCYTWAEKYNLTDDVIELDCD